MSDTPRTDQCASYEGSWDTKALRMTAHAKQLERELNVANIKLAIWAPSIDHLAELQEELSIANEGLDVAYLQGHAAGRDSRDPDIRLLQCTIIELRNKLTIAEDKLHGFLGYRLSGPDKYESMADFIENATDEEMQDLVAWTKERRGD